MPGTVVGQRYRLTTLIATDAAGNQFWQARDTVLSRDMAVTLLPGVHHTAGAVTRTLRVGRLGHPGLPQTLDVGTQDGGTVGGGPDDGTVAYIAGQWADGVTLTELVAAEPLDVPAAGALIGRIAAALAEVHGNGMALGALHPSLVRIAADGTVRFSHVIAHVGATTDDDIRAAGALWYFMLTGDFPLAAGGEPAAITPLDQVAPQVPAPVVTLIDRMLHPDGAKGVQSIDTVVELLAPAPPTAGGAAPGGPPRAAGRRAGGRTARRAAAPDEETRLRQERRVKLSVAGVMLAVFAVLAVVMVSSLAKQFLDSIAEPIRVADQERLVSVTPFTTTRTVGTTPTTTAGETTSDGGEATTEESQPPPAEPVAIVDATVYDPQGEPPKDYVDHVDKAFDGDPSTYWMTWVYKQQFGPGGLKDGVGLVLELDRATVPDSVTVSASNPGGTAVEIRTADGTDPALADTAVLGSAELGTDPVSITLADAPESPYLLVWITQLADYQGDTASNQGQFQADITEIAVTGH